MWLELASEHEFEPAAAEGQCAAAKVNEVRTARGGIGAEVG
jgi:hypothetical protein